MPHKDGKVYKEIRNGEPYGISHQDIAAVLGSASLDLGTLCRHQGINMWAMFKPQRVDQIQPLTNQQRKDTQYGLTVTVGDAARCPVNRSTEEAPKWTYARLLATDWFRQDDFCGDSPETEGYARNAPPMVTVDLGDNFTFSFTGNEANGGIRPEQFLVNGLGKAISELYPGVCVYRFTDSGFEAASITTTNKKVGVSTAANFAQTQTLYSATSTAGFGSGVFLILPVLSPEPHAGGVSLGGVSHKVLFLHDAMLRAIGEDGATGTALLTRRVFDGVYFNKSEIGETWSLQGNSYKELALVKGRGLELAPTQELVKIRTDEYRQECRIMATVSLIDKQYTGYGIGDWHPLIDTNGISSSDEFRDTVKTEYVSVAAWTEPIDGTRNYLELEYHPESKSFPTDASGRPSGNWSVKYRRQLVLTDENGGEIMRLGAGYVYVTGNTGTTNNGIVDRLSRISFGNTVKFGNNDLNSVSGLYLGVEYYQYNNDGGGGRQRPDVTSEEQWAGIRQIDSADSIQIFGSTETGARSLPTETHFYLDVSIDTFDTQKESLPYLA